MAEKKKGSGFISWLTAGADGNKRYVEQLADLEANIADASAGIMKESGAMTDEEAAAWRATQQAGIDENTAENLKRVTRDCTVNGVINAAGLVTSLGAAGTEIAGAASKGAAALGLRDGLASSTLTSSASGVKRAVGRVLGVGEKAAGGVWSGVTDIAKGHLLRGAVKTAAGVALPFAPFAATRMYTESRTAATKTVLNDAADACKDRYAYLLEKGGDLTEEQQEAYGSWSDGYESGMAELAAARESMTEEEYAEAYEALTEKYDEERKALDRGFAEQGLYITDDGAAANLEAHLEKELDEDPSYDWEAAAGASYFNRKSLEEHPERAEQVACVRQTVASVESEGSFLRFVKDLNAAILHYVPGLAYVEAAVVKGADSLLSFIANDAPLVSGVLPDRDEKHGGETITEIARGMVEEAEGRYAAKEEVNGAVAAAEADADYLPA